MPYLIHKQEQELELEEIAAGYAEALCFTTDPAPGSGEYEAPERVLEELEELSLEAARAFADASGWGALRFAIRELGSRTVGRCLHYAREGHGVTFEDRLEDPALRLLQQRAERLGPDDDATMRALELLELREECEELADELEENAITDAAETLRESGPAAALEVARRGVEEYRGDTEGFLEHNYRIAVERLEELGS